MPIYVRTYTPTAEDFLQCPKCQGYGFPFPDKNSIICSYCYDRLRKGLPIEKRTN